ncbi:MAG: UDP-N-acetylmuramate dehydrogenase [Actinomycetota bacterium]|nr:UDP-N-acetylmuramate dehydrogenase [Actinomycetota bacterium]
MDAVGRRLADRLGAQVEFDAPSAPLTTYRCGGRVAVLVRANSEDDVLALAESIDGDVPVVVIGRGSNLLVADSGFAGVAIVLGGELDGVEIDTDTSVVVAGGATPLPVLARRSAAAGVTGLEFFVGIPGSVGGAVRMNAGGHGSETADVLVRARVLSLADGAARDVDTKALDLGYRASAVDPRSVVVGAVFQGRAGLVADCEARVDEIVRWRREHQPGGQNAGSVFTNPPGDAAGRLIEAAGCKGLRVGAVVVSPKHANFFVAEPGARAGDVVALIREVQQRVEMNTGIHLEPELHLVGFAPQDQ